jgi:hypothetical protein
MAGDAKLRGAAQRGAARRGAARRGAARIAIAAHARGPWRGRGAAGGRAGRALLGKASPSWGRRRGSISGAHLAGGVGTACGGRRPVRARWGRDGGGVGRPPAGASGRVGRNTPVRTVRGGALLADATPAQARGRAAGRRARSAGAKNGRGSHGGWFSVEEQIRRWAGNMQMAVALRRSAPRRELSCGRAGGGGGVPGRRCC